MKLPKSMKINVKGKKWTLKFKDIVMIDGIPVAGSCCYRTRTIEIMIEQSKYELADTVIHEFMHAAAYENGIMGQSISMDQEHFIIYPCSDTIVENAAFLAKILKRV